MDEIREARIARLAAEAFTLREYAQRLEMAGAPQDYEARKQAYIDLRIARAKAMEAEVRLSWAMVDVDDGEGE